MPAATVTLVDASACTHIAFLNGPTVPVGAAVAASELLGACVALLETYSPNPNAAAGPAVNAARAAIAKASIA